MRLKVKPLVILSLVLLLIANFPVVSEGSETTFGDSAEPAYDSLPDQNMKDAYTAFKSGVESYSNTPINVRAYNLSTQNMQIVMYAYQSDHPYYFWANYYNISYDTRTQIAVSVSSDIVINATKMLAMCGEIEDAVSSISISGGSFGDRVKSIQDTITDRTTYEVEGENTGNIYGVFVEGKSKCDGYALAVNYLCQKCNIESMCIIGTINDEEPGKNGHAWNIIQADNGNWYYLDATWDDVSDKMHRYDYFMIGSDTDTPSGKISEKRTIYFCYGKTVSSGKYDYDPLFTEHLIIYGLIAAVIVLAVAAALIYYFKSRKAKRLLEESFSRYDDIEKEKKEVLPEPNNNDSGEKPRV